MRGVRETANVADQLTEVADGLLRPRQFSERKLASDGLSALMTALKYLLAAGGLLLFGVGISAGSRTGAQFIPQLLAWVVLVSIPMAALLYLLQFRRGIGFVQCLAIIVLTWAYAVAIDGLFILPLWLSDRLAFGFVSFFTILLLLYIYGFIAPNLLIAITKIGYGAAVGIFLIVMAGACLVGEALGGLYFNFPLGDPDL